MVYRGIPQCSQAFPYSGCHPLHPGLHMHENLSSTEFCFSHPTGFGLLYHLTPENHTYTERSDMCWLAALLQLHAYVINQLHGT